MEMIAACVLSFAVTAVLGRWIILPALRRLKAGQEIRDVGPKWHASKAGTPTMGGLMFIAGIAAAMGGMADILTVPVWAPATVVIKMLIVLPFTCKEGRIPCPRNIAAPFLAAVVSAAGYYLAEGILFGSFAAPLASLAGSAVQSGGSAVIFLALAAALDKMHMKNLAKQILK